MLITFFQKYKLYFRFLKILCSPSRCPLNLPRTEGLSINKYAAFSNYPTERSTGSLSVPASQKRNTKREDRMVNFLAVLAGARVSFNSLFLILRVMLLMNLLFDPGTIEYLYQKQKQKQ